MAIEFANVSIHSRSKGHSAVAGSAYRAGVCLTDIRTGRVYDFSNRSDVVYASILKPENASEAFLDREYLWNGVEAMEKRKDSQLAKDVVLALPKELSEGQQIELARQFAQDHFVSKGLIVDLAIHDHSDGNPHAHLYVTTRRVLDASFDRYKARDLNPSFANWSGGTGFVSEQDYWSQVWRDDQNQYFKHNRLSLRVDERQIISQRHEGKLRGNEKHYVREENHIRREASVDITLNDPAALLNEIGARYAVFSDYELKAIILKNTDTQAQYDQALAGVMHHTDLITLGAWDDGRVRYTSRGNYECEAHMVESAEVMKAKQSHAVNTTHIRTAIKQFSLNDEQATALFHLGDASAISVIVGRAGTGKSYMMNAAREMWQASGYWVYGMAPSGVAAKGLEQSSGISSRTIAYYRQLIQNNAWNLSQNSVVVMDEAGMTDLKDMAEIVRFVHARGAKLVPIGDHDQLQPVGPGAPFRALLEMIGFAEMNHIMRQRNEQDRQATLALSQGNVAKALDSYHLRQQVHLLTADQVKQHIIRDWAKGLEATSLSQQLMVAHTNVDVAELNQLARAELKQRGALNGDTYLVQAQNGTRELMVGERILFLKNDQRLGVANGECGQIQTIAQNTHTQALELTVAIAGKEKPITFLTGDYAHFDYGYASTVHKSQGATYDNVFVLASRGFNRFLTYVALSRHRNRVDIYADQSTFSDRDALHQALARDSFRDSILEWPISYALRRGFDPDSVVGRFIERAHQVKRRVHEQWLWLTNYEDYLKTKQQRLNTKDQHTQRQMAVNVAAFVDLHREVGKVWRELKNTYKTTELIHRSREYAAFTQLMQQKQQLGFELIPYLNQIQTAMKLNHITSSTIEQAADRHVMDQRVLAYVHAYQSGHQFAQAKLATEIAHHMKAHYGALIAAAKQYQIPKQPFIQSIQHNATMQRFYQAYRQANTDEKHVLKTVKRYYEAEHAQKRQWANLYQAGGIEHASPIQLKDYAHKQQQLDQLATKVSTLQTLRNVDTSIELFKLDAENIQVAADRHTQRKTIQRYQGTDKIPQREKLAADILANRGLYRYVYEQEVSWKHLFAERNAYDHKQLLKHLNLTERNAYRHVSLYQSARMNCARAWSSLIDDEKQHQFIDASRREYCWAITKVRNRLAYQIALDPKRYATFLEKTKITIDDLYKHASAHSHHLKRQQKFEQSKTKQTRQTTKKPLAQQAAYDSVKKQWRYDIVNDALLSMGEKFYETILGIAGKREGTHHMRYGEGHALLYAHSGDKIGSWHSFSSGEGGGPIQLLMSNAHGWGLSYQDALKEGARMAGLSAEQTATMVNPTSKTIQQAQITAEKSKQKQAEDNKTKENKRAAARYYYLSAEPIQGTLGERYLRDIRKIEGNIDAVKFHPKIRDTKIEGLSQQRVSYHPGIVIAAKNEHGEITGSQTILLDPKTANKVDTKAVGAVKRSRGEIKGSAVEIQTGKSNQVIIAEGNETALSLTTSLPDANIYVTLGNIKNAEQLTWLAKKHNTHALYFAADNDGKNQNNIIAIYHMARTFKHEHNINTFISKPTRPETQEKIDFNDVLQHQGQDTLKKQLSHWKKVTIQARETIVEPEQLKINLQETLSGKIEQSKTDKDINDKQQNLSKINVEEQSNKIINYFIKLIQERKQTTDVIHLKAIENVLDKKSIELCSNKDLEKYAKQLNPKVFSVIQSRFKITQSHQQQKNTDLDLEL